MNYVSRKITKTIFKQLKTVNEFLKNKNKVADSQRDTETLISVQYYKFSFSKIKLH